MHEDINATTLSKLLRLTPLELRVKARGGDISIRGRGSLASLQGSNLSPQKRRFPFLTPPMADADDSFSFTFVLIAHLLFSLLRQPIRFLISDRSISSNSSLFREEYPFLLEMKNDWVSLTYRRNDIVHTILPLLAKEQIGQILLISHYQKATQDNKLSQKKPLFKTIEIHSKHGDRYQFSLSSADWSVATSWAAKILSAWSDIPLNLQTRHLTANEASHSASSERSIN